MKTLLACVMATTLALPGLAETVPVDPGVLEARTVYEVATLTPLALTAGGSPAVVLLDVAAGDIVPPHAADSDLRLITVVAGDLYWGDGDTVDPAKERHYPAGSILLLPAGQMHWVAARDNAVRLQLVILDDEAPVPGVSATTN